MFRANKELVAGESTEDIVATLAYNEDSIEREDVRDDSDMGRIGVLEWKCGAKLEGVNRAGSSVDADGGDGGGAVAVEIGAPATTPGTRKLASGGW